MTNAQWRNTVNRTPGGFVGGIMRTLGGSTVQAKKCPHVHPTWGKARDCAASMEEAVRK